jgi:transcriptional regulator with XRE-family HTH domain
MAASTFHRDYQLLIGILKEARKQRGVTQVDLADRLGNTQTFVSKMERGERRLDVVEFVEICEALIVAPCDLLSEFLRQRKRVPKSKSTALKISKKNRA